MGYVRAEQEATFSQRVGPRAYEVLARCSCQLLRGRVERFCEAGIPGVLAHADFEDYTPPSAPAARAREMAIAFALSYRRGQPSKGFILGGPVGTGKTHLLVAALRHLVLEVGARAEYREISLLYADIRRGFQEGKSGGEIIGPLSEVEVLAIDELGKGRGSPFELETMDELIARRYNAGRTTLLATNYSLAYERKAARHPSGYQSTEAIREKSGEPELLRDRVGERIYSRLCEMCDFVELPPDTPDHRHMQHDRDRPSTRRAPGHGHGRGRGG